MCLSGSTKQGNGVCGMIQLSDRSWMCLMCVMRSSPIITRYEGNYGIHFCGYSSVGSVSIDGEQGSGRNVTVVLSREQV